MKATPDQHDPDWPKYPETILTFASQPRVIIDLRSVVTEVEIAALKRIGLGEPFAVITAFDPQGRNLSRDDNNRLAQRLEEHVREKGREFIRVDACSPDDEHCECSVAVRMPEREAVSLAVEFEQVAIFWYDGRQFWIVGALIPTDPMMLPRSS